MNESPLFSKIVADLEAHYGKPQPPAITDPLGLVLYETIAYLASDERRDTAFDALRTQVGLEPTAILAASMEKLTKITRLGGIHPELRAVRLKEIAQIVLTDFDGDLNSVLALSLPKALKALRKFPAIGAPGAEKILLFTKTHPLLSLEQTDGLPQFETAARTLELDHIGVDMHGESHITILDEIHKYIPALPLVTSVYEHNL